VFRNLKQTLMSFYYFRFRHEMRSFWVSQVNAFESLSFLIARFTSFDSSLLLKWTHPVPR